MSPRRVSPWARGRAPTAWSAPQGKMAPSGGCLSPENRLRGTKLADPSGIRPKSLPRTFLGRRRPSRREVPLKQPVGDLEHLGEIFPHIPVLQRGEKAGAAKAVNQRSEKHTSELQSLMRISY